MISEIMLQYIIKEGFVINRGLNDGSWEAKNTPKKKNLNTKISVISNYTARNSAATVNNLGDIAMCEKLLLCDPPNEAKTVILRNPNPKL